MSFRVLVRRITLDPYRSRSLHVLLFGFVSIFGLIGYLVGPDSFTPLPMLFASMMALLAPLAALVYSHEVVSGPRQSGSLRVMLSYPYSRREFVLGSFLGRAIVLAIGVTLGILAGTVTALLFGGAVDVLAMGLVAVLAVVLATVSVAIGVGISASVRTTTRSAVGAFGAFLLFFAFWEQLPTIPRYVLNGFSFPTGQPPEWVAVWAQLNPFTAFQTVVTALLEAPYSPAVYHGVAFGLGILLAWLAISLLVGLVRFDRADL